MKDMSKHQNILDEAEQIHLRAKAGTMTDLEVDIALDELLDKADKQGFTALRVALKMADIHGAKEDA